MKTSVHFFSPKAHKRESDLDNFRKPPMLSDVSLRTDLQALDSDSQPRGLDIFIVLQRFVSYKFCE